MSTAPQPAIVRPAAQTPLKLAMLWSLIQHWGARAISFVVFFILARLLTPADFGLVAISLIVIGFTEIFIDQGFSDAVVQSHDDSEAYLSTAFWVNMAMAAILTVVVLAASNLIAVLFHAPRIALITRVLSITFLFTALSSVQIALLRRSMNYRALAVRTMIANVLSGVAAITMALIGFGVWSLVVQQIVFSLVSMVVVWRVGAFRPSFKFDRNAFGGLMHFGLKVCGVRTTDLMHTKLIDSLVGVYLGAVVLGIYSVGTRLGLILLQLLGTSVADVSLAHFSDLRRSKGDLAAAFLRMTHRLAITSVPIFAYLTVESRPLVHVLFGQKWDLSVPIFAAFCGSGIVQVLINFCNAAMSAVGRPGLQFLMSALKLALYIAGFYLCYHHGLATIAWCMTAITVLIITPVSFLIAAHLLQFSLLRLLRTLAWPYIWVAVAALLTVAVNRHLPAGSIVSLVAGTLTFFCVLLGLAYATDREARLLLRRLLRPPHPHSV